MLSTEQLAAHLESVTYKPGWTFRVYDGRWEGQHLVIQARVPDAFKEGESVVLDVHCFVPPMETVKQFQDFLMWRLGRIEVHEMREFFKVGGKVVDSPHKANADQDL